MLRIILSVLLISVYKMSFADTLKAQRYLNSLGYNAGAEDGLWGGKTENALEQFLLDAGKSWYGEFDDEFKFLENVYFEKFPPKVIRQVPEGNY